MNYMKKFRIISLILIIIVCFTIFCFSAQNGETSGEISGSLTYKILKIINPDLEKLPENEKASIVENFHRLIRKSAHFTIFALLGFFTFGFISTFDLIKPLLCFLYSEIFVFFYATTDEIHQLFVANRSGQFSDVLIDCSGGIVGIFFMFIVLKIFKVWRKRQYEA